MTPTPSVYQARPATLDDLDEITLLLSRVFGVHQSAEFLKWKFTGYSGQLAGSTVLTTNQAIVGFLGQIPMRIRVAGHDVLATQGADVAILEEHRRLDAFLNLLLTSAADLEAKGVALAYGTANADATLTLSTLLGQPTISFTPLLVLPLNHSFSISSRHGYSWLMRLLTTCIRMAERGSEWVQKSARQPFRVVRLERFDARFDSFWQRIQNDYPIMLVRDAAHLNWRYVDAPGVSYERIGLENMDSGEIEGYAVLGLSRRGDQLRGRICDLITPLHQNRHAAHQLITSAVQWLRAQSADVADIWMFPHTHLRFALRRHGFIPRHATWGRFQATTLMASASLRLHVVKQVDNWFLSMGDSDTV